MLLSRIIAQKETEVNELKKKRSGTNFVSAKPYAGRFLKSVSGPLKLIAEVKRSSPSAGMINADLDPVKQAVVYEKAGASAISVLTDKHFFSGSIDDLIAVKKAVTIPVLRKDFIIAEEQVVESAEAGADAVLLIVRILGKEKLGTLLEFAMSKGLDALVEVHNAGELKLAASLGAKIIGINNRDLDSLSIEIDVTARLMAKASKKEGTVFVSESGLRTAEDINAVRKAGVDAVLIGEALMKSTDPGARIKELLGG